MVRCFLLEAALYNLSVIVASLDATSPSRGGLGIPLRFRAYALRYFLFCCRQFFPLRQMPVLEPQAITAKNESPAKGSPTRGAVTALARD